MSTFQSAQNLAQQLQQPIAPIQGNGNVQSVQQGNGGGSQPTRSQIQQQGQPSAAGGAQQFAGQPAGSLAGQFAGQGIVSAVNANQNGMQMPVIGVFDDGANGTPLVLRITNSGIAKTNIVIAPNFYGFLNNYAGDPDISYHIKDIISKGSEPSQSPGTALLALSAGAASEAYFTGVMAHLPIWFKHLKVMTDNESNIRDNAIFAEVLQANFGGVKAQEFNLGSGYDPANRDMDDYINEIDFPYVNIPNRNAMMLKKMAANSWIEFRFTVAAMEAAGFVSPV